jgi:hypothetical protein
MAPATGNGGNGGDDGHHHGNTVRVLSINTEESFVDADPSGPSLGDEYVFTSDLTRHGQSVGHTGVVCTMTSVVREESQCLGTAYLRWGQITVQGLIAGEPDEFELAVTGGTGAFEGAGGTLVVTELPNGSGGVTRELLTFHLD